MPRKALSLILFGLSTLWLTAQSPTLYWVGGTGDWEVPANWSTSSTGGSTGFVPSAETDIVVPAPEGHPAEIQVNGVAVCRTLTVAPTALISVAEGSVLSLTQTDHPERISNAGTVVVQQPPAPFARASVASWQGVWFAPDALAEPGFFPLSSFNTDCATDGANPYNIDIDILSDYNGQAISCNTAADGELTVNITGGIGPFSFQWVGGSLPPTFTQTIDGLAAGTYTVLVTDLGQGTICSETIVLNAPPAITLLDFTPSPPSCATNCDGSASVIAIGGTGTLNYAWSNGETGQNATMLCNGDNSLTVTDANGCVYTTDIPLALDTLYANITINDILCNGQPDGSATANPIGGDGGPYTISWSNGDGGPTMSGVVAGMYTATILDGSGCQIDTTFEITEEPPMLLTLDNTVEPSCGGAFDGSIDVSISGGLPPYTTSWEGPGAFTSSDEDLTGIGAGDYTLTVTDANLCEQTLTVTLDEPLPIDVVGDITPLSCAGAADGAIDLTVSGGTGPYDFAWTALPAYSATTEDISGLEAATYTVVVTDLTGCFVELSFDLTEPDPLLLDLVATPITCAGEDDGAIDLTVTGGTPDYTFSWDLNGTATTNTEDLSSLAPGTYTVTVTDDNGCQETASIDLNEPPLMQLDAAATPVSCFGDSDGAIDLTITGGTAPIDTDWTGPNSFTSTDEDLSGLEPGTYTVTATDAAGCEQTLDVTIDEPLEIIPTATPTPLSCAGAADGSIELEISGGTAPYATDWTGPNTFTSSDEDLSGLEAGTYTVLITDANDCTTTLDVEVTEPPALDVVADLTDVLCAGDASGAIDLTVTGGTPNYDFAWVLEGGGTAATEDLTGLIAGDYELTLTDAAGCQVVINYTINENPPFDLTEAITPLSCAGASDGAIDITLSGGAPPFTFSWTGPNGFTSIAEDITGLEAGPYDLDVTDLQGCSQSYSFTVDEPEAIVLSANITDTSCGNTTDGEIDLSITGGVPNLDIAWTGPNAFTSTNEDLTGLEAGTYDVTVTDANGCQQTSSFEVLPGAVLDITSNTGNVSCFGAMDGFIDLTISGGNPPIDVLWTLPDMSTVAAEDLTGLGPGTYDVTVSDVDGCAVDLTFDITEPFELLVDATPSPISCNSANDGAIDLNVAGGEAPYDIAWTGPSGFNSTNEDLTNLGPGTYTVVVTDNLGCSETLDVDLTEPLAISLLDFTTPQSCADVFDGTIDLTILGGTPDFTIAWTGPNAFTADTEDLSGLEAGTYTAVVTDANGCSETTDVEVTAPLPLDTTTDITHITCFGPTSGAIDLTVSGGQGPYTVTWTLPDFSTVVSEDLSNVPAGDYEAVVEDASGCTVTLSATIDENPPFDVIVDVTDATCAGLDDGSISLTISGGVAPYTVDWGFATGPVQNGLAAGLYDVTITDDVGCIMEINGIEVGEAAPLVVDVDSTPESCVGAADGTISILSVSGGMEPYDISWTGPNGFTSTDLLLTDLEAGTYSLSIEDNNGCTYSEDVELTSPTAIVVDAVVVDPICGGGSSITLNISGGDGFLTDSSGNPIPVYLVEWTADNGFTLTETVSNSTSAIADLDAGTYTVVITDGLGCTYTEDFVILAVDELDVQSVVIQPGCGGAMDGSIELAVSGGTAPLGIAWTADNGFSSSDEDIFGLAEGTYTLTVTDANDCIYTEDFTLTSPPAIDYTLDVSQPLCAGEANGAIDLTLVDGTAPYTILWTGPNGFNSPAEDISNLEPGTYTLDIQDATGCAITATVDLDEASPITVDGTVTHLECAGGASGAIDITVTGGTEPFDFAWSALPFFTSDAEDLTGLEAAFYELVVTDANGCEGLYAAEVTENPAITLTASGTDATCGLTDGTLTATATGGEEPYTWSWTNDLGDEIGTDADVANVASGVYTLTLTDNAGCTETATVTISDTDGPELAATGSDPLCDGQFNGTIDLTITGDGPFGIAWTGPNAFVADTEDIADLEAGTYAVEVTDVNGCTATLSYDLTAPAAIDGSAAVTPVACGIAGTGAIDLTVAGGTEPYLFAWTGPDAYTADTEDISGLNIGDYTVTVTDVNGCTFSLTATVDESPALDISTTVTDVACANEFTGAIDLVINSGVAPYQFVWTGPNAFAASTEDLTGLEAGDYTVDVLDDNGCTAQLTVTVAQPEALDLTINTTPPACLLSNGELEAVVTGGTVAGDYTFVWTDTDNGGALLGTTAVLSGIPSGNYHLVVADDNGCTVETDVALSDVGATLDATTQDVLCYGDATGTLDLTVTDGNPDFVFDWTGPDGFSANTEDLTDLAAGTYIAEVTDALGCFYSEAFEITQPDSLAIVLTAGDVLCATDTNGAITSMISGGTAPYTFSWSGPDGFTASDPDLSDLAPGCYTLTVTDLNGCSASEEACIDAPSAVTVDAVLTHIVCAGDSTGVIEWVPSGGVEGFTATWTGPNGAISPDPVLDTLIAGDYTLNLIDANGCVLDTTFTLTENPLLTLDAVATSPLCTGDSNGTIDATLSGGTPDYIIGWTGPDGFTADTEDISDLAAGWYYYTITDAAGCSVLDSLELMDALPLDAVVDADSISCWGMNDGAIDLTPEGGMEPYTFDWNGPNDFTADTEDLTDLEPGTYEVTLTDLAGCTGTLSINVGEPAELQIQLMATTAASCPEAEDGSATIQISGGTPEYEIVWSGPLGYTSLEEDPTDLPGGQYAVTVQDANNCQTVLQPIEIETLGGVEADAGADLTFCEETGPWTLLGTNTGASSEGWYDLDGNVLNTASTLDIQPEPGTWTYVYMADDGLCSDADTIVVEILPSPLADAGEDVDVYLEEVIQIGGNPAVEDGSIWDWSPGVMLQDSTEMNPFTLEILEPQSFVLEVLGENGCMAQDTIHIGLIPLLDIPSGFSPNDDGMNDSWTLGYLSFYPNTLVQIYNRWGDLLFESEPGYPDPWDGTYNGNALPIGTYYYVIHVNEPEFPEPLTGPLTILR